MSAVAWLWVQSQETRTARVRVDLELLLPPDLVSAEGRPQSAVATVEGPWGAVRRVQAERPTLQVDLRDENAGLHEVPLDPSQMQGLPSGLRVAALSPDLLRVPLEPRMQRTLKVTADWVGEPIDGQVVRSVVVEPSTVSVTGARGVLDKLGSIPARAVDVSGWDASREVPAEIQLPPGLDFHEVWTGVARVELESALATVQIEDVPVVVRDAAYVPAPGSEVVSVTLEGPATVLQALARDRVVAVVQLPEEAAADGYTARFRSGRVPRLDLVHPREDVVTVSVPPQAVEVVRR